MILAGDIGGTSSRIGLFEIQDDRPVLKTVERYPSSQSGSLEDILSKFLETHPAAIECGSFGIAGPVRSETVVTPNLPWKISQPPIRKLLQCDKVWLINDLEANAYGAATLDHTDLISLNPNGEADPEGNAAIISAGTGLGEAGFYFDGERYRPFASEGGHSDFAPRNELEAELFLFLVRRYGHVSYERVLSGPGLVNIYTFLRNSWRGDEPEWLAEELERSDRAAVIARHGLDGACDLCVKTLDLFVSLYGSEAGNLALKMNATHGVWIGGGIAPKIIKKFHEPLFLNAFVNKGRMKELLEKIPVEVILNDQTALLGAAWHAALEAGVAHHPKVAA